MKQGSLLKYLIKQKGFTVKEFSEMAGQVAKRPKI